MYCEKCGNKIEKNSKFCSICGEKVELNIETKETTKNKKSWLKKSVISAGIFYGFIIFLLIAFITMLSVSSETAMGLGWMFVLIAWLSILPLIISFILSIIAIKDYRKDKEEKTKLEKTLHVLNWISLVLLGLTLFLF